MTSQTPYEKLGDLCQILTGGTPLRTRRECFGGAVPWVKITDMLQGLITATEETLTDAGLQNSSAKLLPRGTVLISIFATIGRTAILDIEAATNQAIAGLCINDPSTLDARYLKFSLDAHRGYLNTLARGVAQPNINQKILKNLEIPFPPIAEQRRIVDLLSRAENILRLRREAQAKAQAIIPALFLDMFGDPATNPKGWPVRPFASVGTLDRGRSRHRPRDAVELYGGPYPFIQTGDVANSGGRITAYTTTYSEAGLQQSKLWPVGTLCITIAANIAKTGVLTFEACFPDSVVGFLPGDDVTTPYIQGWLSFLQPTIEANAPQAAQKNINLEILRVLPVPVPPLLLQEQFRRRYDMVSRIFDQQLSAIVQAEVVFQAILAGVFS